GNTSHHTQRTLIIDIPVSSSNVFQKEALCKCAKGHSGMLNSLPALSIIYLFAHNACNTTLPYTDEHFWKIAGIFSDLFPMIYKPFCMASDSVPPQISLTFLIYELTLISYQQLPFLNRGFFNTPIFNLL